MSTYTGNRLSVFVQDFKALGEWLPLIKWNCLAYLITMFRSAATAVWDSSSAVWSDISLLAVCSQLDFLRVDRAVHLQRRQLRVGGFGRKGWCNRPVHDSPLPQAPDHAR